MNCWSRINASNSTRLVVDLGTFKNGDYGFWVPSDLWVLGRCIHTQGLQTRRKNNFLTRVKYASHTVYTYTSGIVST